VLEFLIRGCGRDEEAFLVASTYVSLCKVTMLVVWETMHVPSGQTTDYPCTGYRRMADWYDVLEFGFEDAVARSHQYLVAIWGLLCMLAQATAARRTCKSSRKLPLRQSHTHS
jgi:hypothetical protein